jgi:hypothetical protein
VKTYENPEFLFRQTEILTGGSEISVAIASHINHSAEIPGFGRVVCARAATTISAAVVIKMDIEWIFGDISKSSG